MRKVLCSQYSRRAARGAVPTSKKKRHPPHLGESMRAKRNAARKAAKARHDAEEFNSCRRKKAYATRREAWGFALEQRREFGVEQRAYQCPHCHGYHLATNK